MDSEIYRTRIVSKEHIIQKIKILLILFEKKQTFGITKLKGFTSLEENLTTMIA